MNAINRGNYTCRIVSRRQTKSPKEYSYTVQLDSNMLNSVTTATVVERTNVTRNIGDEYIVTLYDDPKYNVFVKKL